MNKRSKLTAIFFSLVVFCVSGSLAHANLTFKDRDGVDIKLQSVASNENLTVERKFFIESFALAYAKVPLTVFNPDFKTREQLNQWLGAAFDEEVELLKAKKISAVRAIRKSVSVGIVFFEKLSEIPRAVYIRQTAVRNDMQNKGIGGRLIFSVRDDASLVPHTANLETLYVIVRFVNSSAIGFYKGRGFVPSDYMHEGYSREKYTGFEWRKKKMATPGV